MLAKIKWFQVAIILVVLTILAVAGIFLGLIKPENERLTEANTKLETETNTFNTNTAALKPAKQDTVKARGEVAVAKSAWAVYDRRYMPPIYLNNRFTATKQLWNEQLNILGPKVLKYLYNDRSVKVVSESIAIPAPSGDPNYVATLKTFQYDLGNITVAGTFEQVLRHTERWNNFDRLALVDGLILAGNSPTLNGTYNLRIFEITHYDDKVGPPIPQAGPPEGGAAGGFGGGMPMGGTMPMGGPMSGPGGTMSGPGGGAMSGPPPGVGGPADSPDGGGVR